MVRFRWNDWNLDHATRHGVSPAEAEYVAVDAKPPYPEQAADEKWLVRGSGVGGRMVQVVYVVDPDGTIYIIHARPLTDPEKRRYRRRTR